MLLHTFTTHTSNNTNTITTFRQISTRKIHQNTSVTTTFITTHLQNIYQNHTIAHIHIRTNMAQQYIKKFNLQQPLHTHSNKHATSVHKITLTGQQLSYPKLAL